MKIILCMIALVLVGCASNQIQNVPRVAAEDLTPLHIAAGKGDLTTMLNLINQGADVNAVDRKMGVPVLNKAVYSDQPGAVKLLLEYGALVNLQSASIGNTPLHDAISFKKKLNGREVIEVLLRAGASLAIKNRAGFTPLELAEVLKDQESVTLLKEEAKRRSTSPGRALMEAVKQNDANKVSRVLSDVLAPVEEVDDQGFTPLLWASREGYYKIASLLLDRGADPNALDTWMGANSGHKAAYWGRTQVMKLLVMHNLNVNARGLYNGYTPLHDAISGNHVETVRVLILAGARTDIQGHDGKTPVDIARENKNSEILKIMGVN